MAKDTVTKYKAAMVLSGVGDAMGYKNGEWEFCHRGSVIYEEVERLGGVDNINIKLPGWMVSDDTVMHLATGEALVKTSNPGQDDREKILLSIAHHYKECMKDMSGRAPGGTCISGAHQLKPLIPGGYKIPFNKRGGGCGGAMRSMCIGLRYPKPEQLDDLIAVSVEAGRMTHHHPIGFLGSVASALFTAYAVQGRPVISWGRDLMDTLPLVMRYVKSTGHYVRENQNKWHCFDNAWTRYLALRDLNDGKTEPKFPEKYDFPERDAFVKSVSFNGWGGACGHDAPMIAYDALLGAGSNWQELCKRAMFHGGDSDSTGVIAACWFGALYGFEGVSENNYKNLEYKSRLETVAEKLYAYAFPSENKEGENEEGENKEGENEEA